MLMRILYLIGSVSWVQLLLFSGFCSGKPTYLQSYQPLKKDSPVRGIYPKIFSCIDVEEKLCIYFTREDGKIWFFPADSFENPLSTIAYNPSGKERLAVPVFFSSFLTAVLELDPESSANFLFVKGVTNIHSSVSFVSAKGYEGRYSILFGDGTYRNVVLISRGKMFTWTIRNDRNYMFEDGESREVEVLANWGKCSDVVSPIEGVVEGVVFSRLFHGINYFMVSERGASSEFLGWNIVEEKSSPRPTEIPRLYSLKLKGNAYPSTDSTRLSPSYVFGFREQDTIVFVSPVTPPSEISVRYLQVTKGYSWYCSIAKGDGKTYVFTTDDRHLLVFQRRDRYVWEQERLDEFSAGQILSFSYDQSPCVVFIGLNDLVLKISCRIGSRWETKEIDRGFIYAVDIHPEHNNLYIVYSVMEDDAILMRYLSVDLDKLFAGRR